MRMHKVLSGSLAFFCFDCGAMIGASGGDQQSQIGKIFGKTSFCFFFKSFSQYLFSGLYCLIAASISTCILNWNEDVAIFFTRLQKIAKLNLELFQSFQGFAVTRHPMHAVVS